jgi:hypothetical protein
MVDLSRQQFLAPVSYLFSRKKTTIVAPLKLQFDWTNTQRTTKKLWFCKFESGDVRGVGVISYRWSTEFVHSSLHKILWNGQREKPKIPRCANGQQDRHFIVAKSRHTARLSDVYSRRKFYDESYHKKTSLTVNASAVGKLRRLNKSTFSLVFT